MEDKADIKWRLENEALVGANNSGIYVDRAGFDVGCSCRTAAGFLLFKGRVLIPKTAVVTERP